MADHYDYFCKTCRSELSECDKKHCAVEDVLRIAPAIAHAARGIIGAPWPDVAWLDLEVDVGSAHVTLSKDDLEWFAEHGDHELVPSLSGVPDGECFRCGRERPMPDGHEGPCGQVDA